MSLLRFLLRLALGRRLPVTAGELRVAGPSAPITVRRDKWGVPHIDAATDADAMFALGFCHGQDRAGQLEVLWRVGRGQLAEWVGPEGLPADRMSRRIGFRRSAGKQVPVLSPETRQLMDAYARGVTAGSTTGLSKKPHEFAILGGEPSAWDGEDVLAVLKLQSFLLPSNWDVELARLRLLRSDGPEAVTALDPLYPEGHPITLQKPNPPTPFPKREGGAGINSSSPPFSGEGSGEGFRLLLDLLAADLAAVMRVLPRGGGSNNWAIAGSRTASGKPLLASDPHLAPSTPPPWYLAHIRTPDWSATGASMVGAPGFAIGHNGFAAWGVTAGLTDNTDLFLETLGPDGTTVREADGTFARCERVREVIRVKGQPDVIEDVLITPRGPVVTPLFTDFAPPKHGASPAVHPEGVAGLLDPPEATRTAPVLPPPAEAVSFRAVWLDPLPVWGFLGIVRARSFDEFRRNFEAWPVLPLNVVYADAAGTTGWQLVGQVPKRTGGNGLIPLPADTPGVGWAKDLVPFDEMPFLTNPARGYVATANNAPTPIGSRPYLGFDFIDGYRAAVIADELGKRDGWDIAACLDLQQNVRSLPWEEIRAVVLSLTPDDPEARDALALLRDWDGRVAADSPAAAVFELAVAELCARVAKARAPKGWRAALGEAGLGATGQNLFADRRVAHLVRLIREQPDDWFARPWPEELADVLGGVVRRLRREVGPGPAYWGWGHLRQLRLEHQLFGKHRLLGPAFNLGPVPCGGDMNTVSQAGYRPLHPTDFTHNMANLRTVFDLADLARSVFILCGGQSGNPCSPHHDDQFPLWQAGEAVTIPWTQEQVIRETRETLQLVPS
ncbi:MAG: penicillin acylase family protein [Gemmataceae bacterium]|nr:penicillin acylase family protein [Gemmataceae bacterium]